MKTGDVRGALPELVRCLSFYPWRTAILVVLQLTAAVGEIAGVSMLIPLLDVIQRGGSTTLRDGFPGWLTYMLGQYDVPFTLALLLFLTAAVVTLQLGITLARNVLTGWLFLRIRRRVQREAFCALVDASQRFFNSHKVGHLVDILNAQVSRTGDALNTFLSLTTNLVLTAAYMSFLFFISWRLTLLMCGVAVGKGLLTTVFTARARMLAWRGIDAGKELSARLIEALYAMRLIKMLSLEEHEKQRFGSLNGREMHPKIRLRINGALHTFTDGIVAVIALCLIVYLSLSVWELRAPLIIVYVAALLRIFPILLSINKDRVQLSGEVPAVASVVMLTEAARRSAMPNGTVTKTTFDSEIVFDAVTFAYDGSSPVVQDICLTIRKGETIAVVGASGAGKSTLMYLLLRLYDLSSGAIRVDGIDLRRLDLRAWHRLVGIVSQDTFIFNDTVIENIRYGRLDATDAEVRLAADRAQATEFIEKFDNGFDTVLGDRGVNISGGQRQRIAIARAFLRDPQILVMDEATNALDSVTEKLIEESMDELAKNRTTVIIAHRLSTVQRADRILVMHGGEIVEEGTHEALLLTEGFYRRYVDLQFASSPVATDGAA